MELTPAAAGRSSLGLLVEYVAANRGAGGSVDLGSFHRLADQDCCDRATVIAVGHPKRTGGRYTKPNTRSGEHGSFDIEVPGVGMRLPKSGLVQLPVEFAAWLDESGLVSDFDDHWHRCQIEGTHGDALTPFATVHEAPSAVAGAIHNFG